MRVPQPDIIEHFGNADAVPQLPERCLSRKAGIVRCCLCFVIKNTADVPDDVGASAVLVFAVTIIIVAAVELLEHFTNRKK